MFQNLPLPAAEKVRDSSSGVTPCTVMKNEGVLYSSFSDIYLRVEEKPHEKSQLGKLTRRGIEPVPDR